MDSPYTVNYCYQSDSKHILDHFDDPDKLRWKSMMAEYFFITPQYVCQIFFITLTICVSNIATGRIE